MARLAHKATDSLGPEALRIIDAGFRGKKTARAIVADLKAIGERVAERTLARRRAEWLAEENRKRAAREHVHHLVEAMKAHNMQASEIVTALATDALVMAPDAFSAGDPAKVQVLNLEAEKIRLKREELALKRAEHELSERKFAVMQAKLDAIREKARKTKAAVERAGESITPELRKQILEVYGLAEAA